MGDHHPRVPHRLGQFVPGQERNAGGPLRRGTVSVLDEDPQVRVAAGVVVDPAHEAVERVVVGADADDHVGMVVLVVSVRVRACGLFGHRSGPTVIAVGMNERCSSHWVRNSLVNGLQRRAVRVGVSMRS